MVAVSVGVLPEPVVATAPLWPPEAMIQEDALVDDQLSADAVPLAIVLGLALRVTDGGSGAAVVATEMVADCATSPP